MGLCIIANVAKHLNTAVWDPGSSDVGEIEVSAEEAEIRLMVTPVVDLEIVGSRVKNSPRPKMPKTFSGVVAVTIRRNGTQNGEPT